jgi:hypothetical protein
VPGGVPDKRGSRLRGGTVPARIETKRLPRALPRPSRI